MKKIAVKALRDMGKLALKHSALLTIEDQKRVLHLELQTVAREKLKNN
ncbi:MAG: hypothetical protein WA432_00235 [Candidatus Babeliaceae bacterium]